MNFYIGISVNSSIPTDIIAAGVAWSCGVKPKIAGQTVPMQKLKESMPAVAVVRGVPEQKVINALCNRVAEKLLIKGYLSPQAARPSIELLMRHSDVLSPYLFPTKKANNHWLLSLADDALTAWLRGDR